jgi:hypothetical protein
VGLSKSEMKFKDFVVLNEDETPNNQIVFDKSFRNFNIDDIIYLTKSKRYHQKELLKIILIRIKAQL